MLFVELTKKVGAQGIEFQTSPAEEEYAKIKRNAVVKNYINQCSQQLMALLIECIYKVSIEDEDDELGLL